MTPTSCQHKAPVNEQRYRAVIMRLKSEKTAKTPTRTLGWAARLRGTRSHSSHHQSFWLSAVIHSLVLSLSLISHNDAWRPPARNDVSTVHCVPVDIKGLIEVTRSTQPIICSPDELIHAACGFSQVSSRSLFLTAWMNPWSRCMRWCVGGNRGWCGRANLDTWVDCSFHQVWQLPIRNTHAGYKTGRLARRTR